MNYEVLYSPEFVKALFLYIEIHFPQPNDSLRIGERFSGPNRGQDGYSVPVTTMNVAPVLWMSLKLKIWECQVGRVGCRGKFPWWKWKSKGGPIRGRPARQFNSSKCHVFRTTRNSYKALLILMNRSIIILRRPYYPCPGGGTLPFGGPRPLVRFPWINTSTLQLDGNLKRKVGVRYIIYIYNFYMHVYIYINSPCSEMINE